MPLAAHQGALRTSSESLKQTMAPDWPFPKYNDHNECKYHSKKSKRGMAKLSPAVDANRGAARDTGAAVRPLI